MLRRTRWFGGEHCTLGRRANVKKVPLWPANLASSSLPAFSLLRVTPGRSSILIGWAWLCRLLIGCRESLLHYRYMAATALPAMRNDWKWWLRKALLKRVSQITIEVEAAHDWKLKRNKGFSTSSSKIKQGLIFVWCHPLLPGLRLHFLPPGFVEVLKMHHYLQRGRGNNDSSLICENP